MLKVNNKDTRTAKVFIVNLEHISQLVLVFFFVNSVQANADWIDYRLLFTLSAWRPLKRHANLNRPGTCRFSQVCVTF